MLKKFKVIAFLIALIILYSCTMNDVNTNPKDNNTSSVENTVQPETENILSDNLPERNFEGYDFRMLIFENLDEFGSGMYAEKEDGDIINDAIYERNLKVAERFNVTISPVFYNRDWESRMQGSKSILAGDDAFDIMFLHMRVVFDYSGSHLLSEWFEYMPYVDLTAPWWSQDSVQDLSLFGKLYGAGGDISTAKLNNTMCLYFNKNLFQILNIEYPYNDVINGTWTMNKFMSIIKDSTADLNGDGAITPDADRYGFAMRTIFYYPTTVPYCGGDKVIKKGSNGEPVLSIYNERVIDIFDKVLEMFSSEAACLAGDKNYGNPQSIDIFKEDRALFTDGTMAQMITFRAFEFDIGVLPIPKYDELTPNYYALIEAHGGLITVPVTVSNYERTSIITEALCFEGYKTVIPVYYEKALKTKFARDDESAEMLDYIKNSGVYDYGYSADKITSELGTIGYFFLLHNPNMASLYAKNETPVLKNLEKLAEDY